jgi:hypothetical protein
VVRSRILYELPSDRALIRYITGRGDEDSEVAGLRRGHGGADEGGNSPRVADAACRILCAIAVDVSNISMRSTAMAFGKRNNMHPHKGHPNVIIDWPRCCASTACTISPINDMGAPGIADHIPALVGHSVASHPAVDRNDNPKASSASSSDTLRCESAHSERHPAECPASPAGASGRSPL